MKAVILIGGLGTRLRPLTLDTPKPLLPVLNKPFLLYQLEMLSRHGVQEAILCTSYRPEAFRKALGGLGSSLRLSFVNEKIPLGTGGGLKNAEGLLRGERTVLALNGDVLNALDLPAFLRFHRQNQAQVTIALTRVKDPTLYGLVRADESGRIRKFLEKPSWDEIETNTINAGAYLFETRVLGLIPPGSPYSLERSLFPQLLQNQARLFGYVAAGYWIDIGTVESYLQAHLDILSGRAPFKPEGRRRRSLLLARGVRLGRELGEPQGGRVLLGPKTEVGDFARFSGNVCVGPGCRIGRGASLEDCVVLGGTAIGEGARLKRCVVGRGCRIGVQASLEAQTALAGGSRVGAYSRLG